MWSSLTGLGGFTVLQEEGERKMDECSDAAVRRYGTAEVSDMTGISAYTIRYYDKCGFFPGLARDQKGIRSFSDEDVSQLLFVDALRKSGLSIEGIQYYVRLQKRGDETLAERSEIVRAQQANMEYQLADLETCLSRLRAAAVKLSAEEKTSQGAVL